MIVRIPCLTLACALCMSVAVADGQADARAKEEASLRAQLDHMDTDVQSAENQLHALERDHPTDEAGKSALRDKIRALDQDEDKVEKRLRELVAKDPPEQRNVRSSTPAIEDSKPVVPASASSPADPARTH